MMTRPSAATPVEQEPEEVPERLPELVTVGFDGQVRLRRGEDGGEVVAPLGGLEQEEGPSAEPGVRSNRRETSARVSFRSSRRSQKSSLYSRSPARMISLSTSEMSRWVSLPTTARNVCRNSGSSYR